jgi:alpha-amylase/alpha-mannosidase (GH57 family)
MILLNYDQRERLIKASSKNKDANKENLDDVIQDLIRRVPYAFGEKTLRDYHRRMNMSRHMGFRKID